MAASAQCGGKENVLLMFNNRGIDAWSIWSGKQFLFTGMGEDELAEILSMIEKGSNVCYTLKVYKGITNADEINEKTPASGSFNFYVKDRNEVISENRNATASAIGAIEKVINEKIAKKIAAMLDKDDQDQPYENKLGLIGEILEHPVLGNIFEKVALQWLAPSGNPGAVAQMQTPMRAVGNLSTDNDLVTTLEKLKKHDPQLTDHLKKLLAIAEASPETFSIFISSLEKITLG